MLRWELTLRLAAAGVVLAVALAHQTPARAEPPAASPSVDEICRTLAQAAADNDLPEEFFTRLIWQESRFDPRPSARPARRASRSSCRRPPRCAGSPTPSSRCRRCAKSASYLRELRTTFRGSLGLAAAAYNAGPARSRPGSPAAAPCRSRRRPMSASSPAIPPRRGRAKPPPQFESSTAPPANAEPGALRRTRQADAREPAPSPRRSPPARPGGRGASSLPATGPKAACSPPTSGCAASTAPCWASACRWS